MTAVVPTIDVDGAHRCGDAVPVDMGALGPLEVDAPPSAGDRVAANDRARRVGRSDRAEVIGQLARIDLVVGATHEVDTDVPAVAAEHAP